MVYLINLNLSEDIAIGFHSHNNLQLSFANAMTMLEIHTSRHIIIDSSLFGMGRGKLEYRTYYSFYQLEHRKPVQYNAVA
jgi:4-hydroxy 2-oxovalerate aldolase